MTVAQEQFIDGAVHPELIPDVSAYRLWFMTVSLPASVTDAQRTVQDAQLAMVGLSAEDLGVLRGLLESFNVRYAALVGKQNATVASGAASFNYVTNAPFLNARDSLVNSILGDIRSQMTSSGVAKLQAFIQGEKKYMRLSPVNK